MRVTLRWLQEFVDIPVDDPAAVAAVLEGLGHELEGMEEVVPQFDGVVTARVEEVYPHPRADRVRLCRVNTGADEVEVVCGAWNFEAGAMVAYAPPGSTLVGGFELSVRQIRGVESHGMICSEQELGLGDEAAGILVLDPAAPVGIDLAELLPFPDTVFDFSITPNRPDAMSVVGLARDLAAYWNVPLRLPQPEVSGHGAPAELEIGLDDPAGCPRYVGRLVRGITVGPAPLWMRRRLQAVGVRPINNVVDATNYALMELGHPTHAFDAAMLGDTIVVRRARAGETLRTLDGVHRRLDPQDLVIADASRPVAFAGVMGGEDTEVGEATTDVIIEAAYFDPASVFMTSKRHALRTEASARFERGMDPNLADIAAARVAELLAAHAGGTPAPGSVDAYPRPIGPRRLTLAPSEVTRVLGVELEEKVLTDLLGRLGFTVAGGDPLEVTIPTRRPDVTRDVDLIEEIARLHGYDKFPETVATGIGGGLPEGQKRLRRLRELMVGAGYHEAMTFSFIGEDALDGLGLPADDPRRGLIRVANPLREEEAMLRTTLMPSLLAAAARNVERGAAAVALFEAGKVFFRGPGEIPDQPDHLGFVLVGRGGGGSGAESAEVGDATGLWRVVATGLGIDHFRLEQASHPVFHPHRAAGVVVDGEVIGVVGEIHPAVAGRYGLEMRVAGGELALAPLLAPRPRRRFRPPSAYPPQIFDLAFVLDDDVPAADLQRTIATAAGDLLEDQHIFDVYAGPAVGEGRRSLAVRLWLRAPDRTLTNEEVAPVRAGIIATVAAELNGTLRGE